ncbi:MAG: tetratricopeptide repeat protein [Planctomycetota bacterium]
MAVALAEKFMHVVTPALNAGDVEALRDGVSQRWKPSELCGLLQHADLEVRRTAVVTLGIVGDRGVVGCLTRCLHEPDEQVQQFAEDALWSIWFRLGKPASAEKFREGVIALTEDRYEDAVRALDRAIARDPEFAEAYNQLAIAHYLSNQWEASMVACRQALSLMPTHFGAMAGLGHCYAHRGRLRQAIDCYRRALTINPQMSPIADAKARLEKQLAETEADGLPEAADDEPQAVLLDLDFDLNDRS